MSYTSNRPYLIQAMLSWMVDNRLTPYVLVDAEYPGLVVPRGYVTQGNIVLNIAPDAVRDFMLSAKVMTFHARFAGEREDLYIPLGAIAAIYPHETGEGIHFQELDKNPPPLPAEGEQQVPFRAGVAASAGGQKKPHLRIVRPDSPADDNNSS